MEEIKENILAKDMKEKFILNLSDQYNQSDRPVIKIFEQVSSII